GFGIRENDLEFGGIDDRAGREAPLGEARVVVAQKEIAEDNLIRAGIEQFNPWLSFALIVGDAAGVDREYFIEPHERIRRDNVRVSAVCAGSRGDSLRTGGGADVERAAKTGTHAEHKISRVAGRQIPEADRVHRCSSEARNVLIEVIAVAARRGELQVEGVVAVDVVGRRAGAVRAVETKELPGRSEI